MPARPVSACVRARARDRDADADEDENEDKDDVTAVVVAPDADGCGRRLPEGAAGEQETRSEQAGDRLTVRAASWP